MRLDSVSLPGSGKSIIRQRAERTGARCSHRAHRARCVPSTSNRGQADGDPRLRQELGPGLGGPPGHPAPASPREGRAGEGCPSQGRRMPVSPCWRAGGRGGPTGLLPSPPRQQAARLSAFLFNSLDCEFPSCLLTRAWLSSRSRPGKPICCQKPPALTPAPTSLGAAGSMPGPGPCSLPRLVRGG